MLNSKANWIVVATFALINCGAAAASETQRWSVQIVDDTAVMRIDRDTDAEFVQSAISGLQQTGIEKFSLHTPNPENAQVAKRLSYSIKIVDGTAEIDPTFDLSYKYIKVAIDKLKAHGITKIKFAQTETPNADAVSRKASFR